MEVIDTAGLEGLTSQLGSSSKRKMALKEIRATLRKNDAGDEEFEDALDALIELAQDKE